MNETTPPTPEFELIPPTSKYEPPTPEPEAMPAMREHEPMPPMPEHEAMPAMPENDLMPGPASEMRRPAPARETRRPTPARPRHRPGTSPLLSYGSVFLGVALVIAAWRIWALEKQVDTLEAANTAYAQEVLRAQREMSGALVRGAAVRPVDERDAQALRGRHPDEAEVLSTILSLARERVPWSETGDNVSTGFHSAAFVGHVLRTTGHTMGFLELASDAGESRDKLFQNLRYKATPAVGDLAFYPGDLVLFYFVDRSGRPFVMGMTPRGIRAFSPDFVEPLGYREFRFAGRVRS